MWSTGGWEPRGWLPLGSRLKETAAFGPPVQDEHLYRCHPDTRSGSELGAEWHYSDPGFPLAGLIVERASGPYGS